MLETSNCELHWAINCRSRFRKLRPMTGRSSVVSALSRSFAIISTATLRLGADSSKSRRILARTSRADAQSYGGPGDERFPGERIVADWPDEA